MNSPRAKILCLTISLYLGIFPTNASAALDEPNNHPNRHWLSESIEKTVSYVTSSPGLMIAIGVSIVTVCVTAAYYRANRAHRMPGNAALGVGVLALRNRGPFGGNQFEGQRPGGHEFEHKTNGKGPTFGGSSVTFVPSGTGRSLSLSQQGIRSNGQIQQMGGTTSRAFRHPHLLRHLSRNVPPISATGRNVVILGPGRNVDPESQVVSVPELHELAHFFGPSDTIVVVDIRPDIANVVRTSRYRDFDRHIARSIITASENYLNSRLSDEEQDQYRSELTRILKAIRQQPTAVLDPIVADFAELTPPAGTVDFMFGLQSLIYLLENRTDEEIVRHLTRYFAALSDNGRFYVDSQIGDRMIALFNGRRNAGILQVGDRAYSIAQIRPSSDELCVSGTPRVIFTIPGDSRTRFVSTSAIYMFTPSKKPSKPRTDVEKKGTEP